MTESFYDVLGVDPDATTEEIESAYRRRLKETHPDQNDDEDADEQTRRLIRARDVLTDERERERYDDLGHAAYVNGGSEPDGPGARSQAARAAERAGWGDETGTGAASDSEDGTDPATDQRSGRRRAWERRQRERAASERVGRERTADSRSANADDPTTTGRATGGTTTGRKTGGAAASPGTDRSPSGRRAGTGDPFSAPGWTGDAGYNVRRQHDSRPALRRLLPDASSMPILVMTFVLYPVMLFSAFFPAFPLFVNALVAACLVLLIGYLQSTPAVAVVVFGLWTLLTPLVLAIFGIPLTGLVGVVALSGTLLPFALSVLTLVLVPP